MRGSRGAGLRVGSGIAVELPGRAPAGELGVQFGVEQPQLGCRQRGFGQACQGVTIHLGRGGGEEGSAPGVADR
jgi:hypothetical protein